MEQVTIERGNIKASYEQALTAWQRKHSEKPTTVYVANALAFWELLPNCALQVIERHWMVGKVGVGI